MLKIKGIKNLEKEKEKLSHYDKRANRFEREPNKMFKTEKYSHWNQILSGKIK